ncbi:MAG: hypothetical protein U0231_15490 [Nitrospiraceae bacterium]
MFAKLETAVSRFLHVSLDYLGCILLDDYVLLAVTHQRAVIDEFPYESQPALTWPSVG